MLIKPGGGGAKVEQMREGGRKCVYVCVFMSVCMSRGVYTCVEMCKRLHPHTFIKDWRAQSSRNNDMCVYLYVGLYVWVAACVCGGVCVRRAVGDKPSTVR